MARIESDREDLLSEAVALIRRVEFSPTDFAPGIVAGFRKTGWFSVYFGPDLMLQFDADCRLRRAFRDGLLYRTQGQTLARLRRSRSETETTLVRHDLDDSELQDFRGQTIAKLDWFAKHLLAGRLVVSRQIPGDDGALVADIKEFLGKVARSSQFLAPAIQGKP